MTTLRSTIESRIANRLDRGDATTEISEWFETAHQEIQRLLEFPGQDAIMTPIPLVAQTDAYAHDSTIRDIRLLYRFDPATNKTVYFYNETGIEALREMRMEHQDIANPADQLDARYFARWVGMFELWPPIGGTPSGHELRGDVIVFIPPPAQGASDWFTNNAADFLLYRALMESASHFAGESERLATWTGGAKRAYETLVPVAIQMRWGGGPLTMRG